MKIDSNSIFYFYRYVQPIWYLNLQSKSSIPYWIDYGKLPADEQAIIDVDQAYVSEDARLRDAAYQAWQKGILCTDRTKGLPLPFGSLPIKDEYRFISRYFNPVWSFYVLMIRLLSFRNPFIELHSFFNTRNVKRVNIFKQIKERNYYGSFASTLVKEAPKVSIVLPTLNRYSYLRDILNDLEKQTYKNFEVIIIDQSFPFQKEFYKDFGFTLKVIHQQNPGLWTARNRGVRESSGSFIAFTEDDVRVNPDWLTQHLRCMEYFSCDISAGIFFLQNTNLPKHKSFFRWAEQFASGNALVKREVFEKVGLFDLQFERMRMGDGEFGLRCYLNGVESVSNPVAYCLDVKAAEGGLRQMGSWDGFRPTNWFAPRPIPSVLYLTRRYFGNRLAILDLCIKVPASIIPHRYKNRPILLLLASMVAFLLFPLVLSQVIRSWKLSTKMIGIGAKVELL